MKIDSQLLEKAIIFATEKHKGQVRKGDGRPYILHPLSVLMKVNKYKKSKNQFLLAIAAIGHDLAEDTDTTLAEIAEHFGHKVAALVEELSTNKVECDLLGKPQYLLNKMLAMSTYALCIKLCDRLDNLEDMKTMSEEFKSKSIAETRFILEGLINGRDLTKTHKGLIKDIKKYLK